MLFGGPQTHQQHFCCHLTVVCGVACSETILKIVNAVIFFKKLVKSLMHQLLNYLIYVWEKRNWSIISKIKIWPFIFENRNNFGLLQFFNVGTCVKWSCLITAVILHHLSILALIYGLPSAFLQFTTINYNCSFLWRNNCFIFYKCSLTFV